MHADLIAALRSLSGSKTYSLVALLVLALGIGSATAIFSVVDAVVIRALPFDEHDRLVAVGERHPPRPGAEPASDPLALDSASPQNYLDWAERQEVFESVAALTRGSAVLQEPGAAPEDVPVLRTTAGFFDVLGVSLAIGQPYAADNEIDGRHRVVVLSDGFWRQRFGGDPAVVGRTLPLDGDRFEILGVTPPGFAYPLASGRPTDLYLPYVVPESERIRRPGWVSVYLQTIARLRPGVSITQAQAQMDTIAASLTAEHPDWNKDSFVGVRPLHDHIVGASTQSWMTMLLAASGVLLAIVCVNVAMLQLARASTRTRDLGVRAALGAGRGRLIRQVLVENLILALAGAALGALIAWWGVWILKAAMPASVPRVSAIALNLRVLAVTGLTSVLAGVAFGLGPALRLSRPNLVTVLKSGARGTAGREHHRTHGILIVAEVALAVVLLVGAALFAASFARVVRIEPGFDTSQVLTAQIYPQDILPGQPPPDMRAQLMELADRASTEPGVVGAAVVNGGIPLGAGMWTTTLRVPGHVVDGPSTVSVRVVTAAYHDVLRIPLRSGRLFSDDDREGAPRALIINESAARMFFPSESPLGRTATFSDQPWTIVGVVGDIHQTDLEIDPRPEIYVPLAQFGQGTGELLIRTAGDPLAVLPRMRTVVSQVLPGVPLRNVRTLDQLLAGRLAQRSLSMMLFSLFGVLGLVISAVGIYGMLAQVVTDRTREIGVRMALGASRGSVVLMVTRRAGALVALGLAAGSALAWSAADGAQPFLYDLEATDAKAFAVSLGILAMAAVAASAIPARRAASVDPAEALRAE
ncbi:MAG: ABC transporter permease [Vicinamibacterales bacterium]